MVKSDLIFTKKPRAFQGSKFRFQKRTGIFYLIFALFWVGIPLNLSISYSNLPKLLWGISVLFCVICAWRGLIYLTVVLEVTNRYLQITHLFRNRKIQFSTIKNINAIDEENWQDSVRISKEYYLLLKFKGWKRSIQIPLNGWCQEKIKLTHEELCWIILEKYKRSTGKTSSIFPR